MIAYHELFLGSACDNNCVGCVYRKGPRAHSLDDLIQQVDGFDRGENVALTGGEPTLHQDLLRLVAYARKRGTRRIKLVTNGNRLADPGLIERLVEAGCRLFELKLYSSVPEIHERVTRNRGSFDAALQGLRNLVDLAYSEAYEDRLFIAVRVGITRFNLETLPATAAFLAAAGVDRIILCRQDVVSEMTEAARVVNQAIQLSTLNRLWCMSEGFTPCLMAGLEFHLAELIRPSLSNAEKPQGCIPCVYAPFCDGPPRPYIEKHGSREFQAVRSSPYVEDVTDLVRKNGEEKHGEVT